MGSEGEALRPIEMIGPLAVQQALVAPGLRHLELFTMRGLLTLLWHGPSDAEAVVLMCGGGMGGLLGPADGLYHDLGNAFMEAGIGTIRVGYRRPNDLEACVLDMGAAADLAAQSGAQRFVAVGHSFGGAVAINAGLAMPTAVAGVVTLATQSAGCQMAAGLAGRPLLMLHGDQDEILPPEVSETVRMMAGYGDVEILEGTGHLFREVGDELRARLLDWIPTVLAAPPVPPAPPPPPGG